MLKFFKCNHCGNIAEKVKDVGVPIVCCGENMQELVANTTDAATEKHVPVVTATDGQCKTYTVTVGSVIHPMQEAHYIEWIYLETDKGVQRKMLKPGEEPKATFCIVEGKAVAAYEYCNLHGLWKKEL